MQHSRTHTHHRNPLAASIAAFATLLLVIPSASATEFTESQSGDQSVIETPTDSTETAVGAQEETPVDVQEETPVDVQEETSVDVQQSQPQQQRVESDAAPESAGQMSLAPAQTYTAPELDQTTIVTALGSTDSVTIPFVTVGDLPSDQVVNIQIGENGSGSGWTTLYSSTLGQLEAAGGVEIPRSAITSPVLYDVQLTNWGMTPNYYPGDFITLGSIKVTTFAHPELSPADVFADSSSSDPVKFNLTGLGEVPDAQVFNVQVQKPGEASWVQVAEVTAGQIRANGNILEIPRSFVDEAPSYYVEVTNWGMEPDFYPDLVRLLGTITVGDFGSLSFVAERVFANLDSDEPIEFVVDLDALAALPGDQVFNVQFGKAGSGTGWLDLEQVTLDELRSRWGKLEVPRDQLDGEGYYHLQFTNWGMSPNYLPSDLIAIGVLRVGDFGPPRFAEATSHTYQAATADVKLQLENLADLPDDQLLNVQIGQPGTGWQEAGRITLGELRGEGGIVSIPRSLLGELGVHHVQITNWGMEPNYDPEIFVAGTNLVVHEAPTISFVGEDGQPLTELKTVSDTDALVTVAVDGYVPSGSQLSLGVSPLLGDSISSALTVGVPEQLDRGTFSFTIPGAELRAVFGRPDAELVATAVLTLPSEYQEVEVAPATLPISVSAIPPVIGLDKSHYQVRTGEALTLSVTGLDGLPEDLPVFFTVKDASGKTVAEFSVLVGDLLANNEVTIREGLLASVGENAYTVQASVSSYYGEVVSAEAGVTVVGVKPTPVPEKPSRPGETVPAKDSAKIKGLAATGSDSTPLVLLSMLALGGGLLLRRRPVK